MKKWEIFKRDILYVPTQLFYAAISNCTSPYFVNLFTSSFSSALRRYTPLRFSSHSSCNKGVQKTSWSLDERIVCIHWVLRIAFLRSHSLHNFNPGVSNILWVHLPHVFRYTPLIAAARQVLNNRVRWFPAGITIIFFDTMYLEKCRRHRKHGFGHFIQLRKTKLSINEYFNFQGFKCYAQPPSNPFHSTESV